MFILVNTTTDEYDKVLEAEVLDTDDLVSERISSKDLLQLMKSIPDLKIEGTEFDSDFGRIFYTRNRFGNSYYRVSDNYGVIIKKRNGGTARVYFEVFVYKKGVEGHIYTFKTPEHNDEYVDFNFKEVGNKYFVIDVSAMDKHYYGEDGEEYFDLTIILDISYKPVKEVRRDKEYVISKYAYTWGYSDKKLVPFLEN